MPRVLELQVGEHFLVHFLQHRAHEFFAALEMVVKHAEIDTRMFGEAPHRETGAASDGQ